MRATNGENGTGKRGACLALERPQDGFLLVCRGEEGLAVRAQPKNRVFYTQNMPGVRTVIDRIVAQGVERFAREGVSGEDSSVREQWIGMARAGFFANEPSDPIPLYGVVFEMDEAEDFGEALGALRMAEGALRRRLPVELGVRRAVDVVSAYGRLQEAARVWREEARRKAANRRVVRERESASPGNGKPNSVDPPAGGAASQAGAPAGRKASGNYVEQARSVSQPPQRGVPPANQEPDIPVTILSPFLGEGEPDERLVALLDRETISLVLLDEPGLPGEEEGPAAVRDGDEGLLAVFEDMGYLFRIRMVCPPEAVGDASRRAALIREVERIIGETPNREIDLVVERPARFAGLEEVDAYYDALEPFLAELYAIDADPSRLSHFTRYIEGILANRFHPNRLRMRLDGEGLRLGFLSTRTPFAIVPPTRGEVKAIADYLNGFIGTNAGLEACADCPLAFLCPKALCEPYLFQVRRVGEGEIAERVYRRECALHMRLFRMVFDDLAYQASPHMPDGIPLRLDITDDHNLAFRPRDEEEETKGEKVKADG